MCLLCLLLFGCGCDRGCGCGYAQNRASCCGAYENEDGCRKERSSPCCAGSRSQCCCGCAKSCSGFARHGGVSVCCDAEYYNRQYALCCKCSPCCNG
ncbi:MAG TPA: hypothetical protein H9727_00060 [Candidatus Borkfalkia avistercoris]|uniref:Uncharacterized protein n=1 Tax=Candidatus Borkfalkia avistercoris TaxID=2838504 RepID=A0A9D2A656_9FIRM|nr:hypothetical protein [Candidatus Borkfalkia avistercoris]